MAGKPTIDPDMPVDEIMRKWPMTIGVMIRHGMLCVGCPIGIFHTVTDACGEHDIDEDSFVAELLAAIEDEVRTSGGSPQPASAHEGR